MLASGLTANPRAQGFGGVGREEAIRKDPASLILVIDTLKRLHFRMPSKFLTCPFTYAAPTGVHLKPDLGDKGTWGRPPGFLLLLEQPYPDAFADYSLELVLWLGETARVPKQQ